MMNDYNTAENGQIDSDFALFTDKSIRSGFIRKVYGIITVQLFITFGFVCALSASKPMRDWTLQNSWLLWVALITTFVVIIVLACSESARRTTPYNFIALMVFTLAESFLLGVISSMYNHTIVIYAVLITAVICLALTAFAFQTKIDFTIYSGMLFVFMLVLLLFGIIAMFWHNNYVQLIYACLGALLFSAYLVVDTQMIVGGNHKFQMSPEEYIFAALTLYVDMINIFLYILQILQSVAGDN